MKTKYYFVLLLLLLPISGLFSASNTIQYVVATDEDGLISVSLLPDTTWLGADALTSTAQVTLVVPTGGFEVGNLLDVSGEWSLNATVIAPMENPNFDYIVFGLKSLGTSEIEYEKGVETLLFTFENIGECVSSIELMDLDDPFSPPNSENVNLGNQNTTLGGGNSNTWVGNLGIGIFNCPVFGCTDSLSINYEPDATSDDGSCVSVGINNIEENHLSIYPNPSNDQINLLFEQELPQQIQIFDLNGRVVKEFVEMTNRKTQLAVQGWTEGIYIIEVKYENKTVWDKIIVN